MKLDFFTLYQEVVQLAALVCVVSCSNSGDNMLVQIFKDIRKMKIIVCLL